MITTNVMKRSGEHAQLINRRFPTDRCVNEIKFETHNDVPVDALTRLYRISNPLTAPMQQIQHIHFQRFQAMMSYERCACLPPLSYRLILRNLGHSALFVIILIISHADFPCNERSLDRMTQKYPLTRCIQSLLTIGGRCSKHRIYEFIGKSLKFQQCLLQVRTSLSMP